MRQKVDGMLSSKISALLLVRRHPPPQIAAAAAIISSHGTIDTPSHCWNHSPGGLEGALASALGGDPLLGM